jgi:hypothetical protein
MKPSAAWQGASADIVFEPADFDVLDITLSLMPELRICALAVKRARAANVKYPITLADQLVVLLENRRFATAGHQIEAEDVGKYMPKEFFPIEHEGELISRIFIALARCKHEMAVAAHADPEILAKLRTLPNETNPEG